MISQASEQLLVTALAQLGPKFAERAAELDETDTFGFQNFQELKTQRILSAMIPTAFGGSGVAFSQMCAFLSDLAYFCPATALTLSMHQHVVATSIVTASLGRPGEALLRKVATTEALIATTVANDWINSSGAAKQIKGGFEVTANKRFVSGALASDILISSARIDSQAGEPEVIHFSVPFKTDGVHICGEWKAHGMRATGSVGVDLTGVFIPQSAVTLQRPAQGLHPLFHVILNVAPTLIMSCYAGIAKRARDLALGHKGYESDDMLFHTQIGKLESAFTTAKLAHDDMVSKVNELQFEPSIERANEILVRKSIVAENVMKTTERAAKLIGASSYLRTSEIERLLRDSRAAALHPLPVHRQRVFTGQLLCPH